MAALEMLNGTTASWLCLQLVLPILQKNVCNVYFCFFIQVGGWAKNIHISSC